MAYPRRSAAATRPKPRQAQAHKWPAPVSGWIANRALATPQSIEGSGAAVLDNFFPHATGVRLRRGKNRYATMEDTGKDVTALFTYKRGPLEQMFGANDETIYDLTDVAFAYPAEIGTETGDALGTEGGDIFGWGSTTGLAVASGYTGGDWSVVQYATTGGIYLVGVNGEDTGFIYDGEVFYPNVAGGVYRLDYDGGPDPFTAGETLVGGTSSAEATIWRVVEDEDNPGEGYLLLTDLVEAEMTWALDYDSGSGDFVPGEIVTGGTSGATAVVAGVAGTTATGTLTLTGLVGEFENDETITGDIAGAADADGTEAYASGGPFQDNEALTDGEAGAAVADGELDWAAPGMEFGDLTSADMAYVWTYGERLWFAQKDSLSAWYLDVDSIGGEATEFPLVGVFDLGGSLLFGARWSLESGGSGGLSEQIIFVSTQGEVAVYQGISPEEAETWRLVGVYRVGRPLGKHAHFRGGGDIAIATTVGLVPLSKAIALDVSALNTATVSHRIADAWNEAVNQRGTANWRAGVWPEEKMAVIAPPDLQSSSAPVIFVSNTESGAWARYTGWQALCLTVFRGQLYFGSPEGRVYRANVSGLDDGHAYTGAVVSLFEDLGSPASAKLSSLARATTRANLDTIDRLDVLTDFDLTLPPPPDASAIAASNVWDEGVWGTSVWSEVSPTVIANNWQSTSALGYALAPAYQVTSGNVAPLDVELLSIESLYVVGEYVT